jgi:hypothetical protein
VERISAMEVIPGRSWQKTTLTLDKGQQVELEARVPSTPWWRRIQ